jgi:hypothetical protein
VSENKSNIIKTSVNKQFYYLSMEILIVNPYKLNLELNI